MDARVIGNVRGLVHGLVGDSADQRIIVTPAGAVCVAQDQYLKTELARLGRSWWFKNTTAAAALTAMPTTTSGITLYNGEAAGGACYVIDSVAVVEIIPDATQQDSMSVWVALGRAFTAPSAGTVATGSGSGLATYSGSAVQAVAATTVVAASPWEPVGTSAPGNPQFTGSNFRNTEIELFGRHVVVPGGAFHLAASKLAGAASQLFYVIRWTEKLLQFA